MVLVDSCVRIEAGRAKGDLRVKLALEALLSEYEAAFCGPINLEVFGGARAERRRALMFFFDALPYVPMIEDDWHSAVALSWRLRERGVGVPWNDILIGTFARRLDCRVYSVDKHFELLREHAGTSLYQPGYNGGFHPG